MNRKTKRLTVNKQTLRSLAKEELPRIAGATGECYDTVPHSFCLCPSQAMCSKGGTCNNDCGM
jgi:hypothetical protein